MPALVAPERKEVVKAINEDLRNAPTFVNRERIASFEQISRERTAVLQQLDEGRTAAFRELREIAIKERVAFSRDIEEAGLRIVDHAAWRLSWLVALILGFLFLAGVLFLFIIQRLFFLSQEPR